MSRFSFYINLLKDTDDMKRSSYKMQCKKKKEEVFIPFYSQKSELISIDYDQTESAD
jgi:hypothetical protein